MLELKPDINTEFCAIFQNGGVKRWHYYIVIDFPSHNVALISESQEWLTLNARTLVAGRHHCISKTLFLQNEASKKEKKSNLLVVNIKVFIPVY